MTVEQPQICEISHRAGTTLVRLEGVVDAASGLVDVVRSATEGRRPVEVDLSRARLVDWSGIGFLAQLVIAVRPAKVTVSGVGPRVHAMIADSGLERHLVVRSVDVSRPHPDVEVVDLVSDLGRTPDEAAVVRWAQHC